MRLRRGALVGREHLPEGRHWPRVLLRRGHAGGHDLHYRAVASVDVEPLLVGEVRGELRSFRVRSVTGLADAARGLAPEDAVAQRDHLRGDLSRVGGRCSRGRSGPRSLGRRRVLRGAIASQARQRKSRQA
jgi:hypothetical protein